MTSFDPTNLDYVSKCKKCVNLGQQHVPAEGDMESRLMIIGQSPGKEEARQRRPFVGMSGELVNYMLNEIGIDREDIYITNAIKCHPPNNRLATAQESYNCWRTFLHKELTLIAPKLVVLLGKEAHTMVLPRHFKFGHLITSQSKKRTYLSVYHPAYFLRANRIQDFVKVAYVINDLLDKIEAS